MKSLDKYTLEVKKIVDEISDSGSKQEEMVLKINEGISRISNVVHSELLDRAGKRLGVGRAFRTSRDS